MNERICVLAWQDLGVSEVSRGEKLHLREDVELMAEELNREYPELYHWAAPATEAELAVHAAQVARLMDGERRVRGSGAKRGDRLAGDARHSA